MAEPVKYLAGESTGVAFTAGETKSVVVTVEAVAPTTGYEGDTIEYTATVKDNLGEALPATFVVDLLYNGTKVVDSQVLDATVYDPVTFLLTLTFTVPAGAGDFTVKLSWAQQDIGL